MWQYTSKGSMAGISGNVDISYCYTDFANASSTVSNTIPSNSTTIESVNYTTGTYKLTANLKVRMGAGTSYKAKAYEQCKITRYVSRSTVGTVEAYKVDEEGNKEPVIVESEIRKSNVAGIASFDSMNGGTMYILTVIASTKKTTGSSSLNNTTACFSFSNKNIV